MKLLESWISPKTKKKLPSKIHGFGIFATEPISRGEIVAVKVGHVFDKETLGKNQAVINHSEEQITDNLFLGPQDKDEFEGSMVYVNHSCDPNCGIGGTALVVARRDINSGEELTVDYCMYFAEPGFQLVCNCLSPSCRKVIKGDDWKNPELQKKYDGYFSWYIQQKIKAQNL